MSREILDNVALEKKKHIFVNVSFKNIPSVENYLKRIVPVKDKSMQLGRADFRSYPGL